MGVQEHIQSPPNAAELDYGATRSRVTDYFDSHATETWERLTSDHEVSRIRQTVRAGRDRMRQILLSRLPDDLSGARVLDAGCGPGQLTTELARRGADVLAVDVSPRLLEIAQKRLPGGLPGRVLFAPGDMLDPHFGHFDHVIAMDSLIYYRASQIGTALSGLARRTAGKIVFTVAPRTPLLMAMWGMGQLFPRGDRSPTMVPHDPARLARALAGAGCPRSLTPVVRVHSGFYISTACEVTP
ncbi:magnesium protoporphyrin IX methyltransferase [Palleronia caenipelagi]|uniref:Magnesium protoporphyrin IX methyltransferase n=1 Tax=Palleronia caenipelagi TaxID=2489174 RepID=A0A547Q877_9RHOB|nr:magnesium protoporphyrin IX methyltransferase [Palleronia caenipelagi]TRD22588.1 magnesium protoporphyrin IX methyltransferase [Palleronia caenipelagi]